MAIREELILDLTRARAQADAFQDQLTTPLTIPVDLFVDLNRLRATLEALGAEIPATVDLDLVELRRQLAAIDEPIEIPVTPDVTGFGAELQARLAAEDVVVDIDGDTTLARADIDALNGIDVTVDVFADVSAARADIAALGAGGVGVGIRGVGGAVGAAGAAAASAAGAAATTAATAATTALAAGITAAVAAIRGMLDAIGDTAVKVGDLGAAFDALAKRIADIRGDFGGAADEADRIGPGLGGGGAAAAIMAASAADIRGEFNEITQSMEDALAVTVRTGDQVQALDEGVVQTATDMGEVTGEAEALHAAVTGTADAMGTQEQFVEDATGQLRLYGETWQQAREAATATGEAVRRQGMFYDRLLDPMAGQLELFHNLIGTSDTLLGIFGQFGEELQELTPSQFENMYVAITNVIRGGEQFVEVLGRVQEEAFRVAGTLREGFGEDFEIAGIPQIVADLEAVRETITTLRRAMRDPVALGFDAEETEEMAEALLDLEASAADSKERLLELATAALPPLEDRLGRVSDRITEIGVRFRQTDFSAMNIEAAEGEFSEAEVALRGFHAELDATRAEIMEVAHAMAALEQAGVPALNELTDSQGRLVTFTEQLAEREENASAVTTGLARAVTDLRNQAKGLGDQFTRTGQAIREGAAVTAESDADLEASQAQIERTEAALRGFGDAASVAAGMVERLRAAGAVTVEAAVPEAPGAGAFVERIQEVQAESASAEDRIDALRASAERFAEVLARVEADPIRQTNVQVTELRVAFDALQGTLVNVRNTLVSTQSELTPRFYGSLTGQVNRITAAFANLEPRLEAIESGAPGTAAQVSEVGDEAIEAAGNVDNLTQSLDDLAEAQRGGLGTTEFASDARDLIGTVRTVVTELADFNEAIVSSIQRGPAMSDALSVMNGEFQSLRRIISNSIDEFSDLRDTWTTAEINAFNEVVRQASQSVIANQRALRNWALTGVDPVIEQVEVLSATIDDLQERLRQGFAVTSAMGFEPSGGTLDLVRDLTAFEVEVTRVREAIVDAGADITAFETALAGSSQRVIEGADRLEEMAVEVANLGNAFETTARSAVGLEVDRLVEEFNRLDAALTNVDERLTTMTPGVLDTEEGQRQVTALRTDLAALANELGILRNGALIMQRAFDTVSTRQAVSNFDTLIARSGQLGSSLRGLETAQPIVEIPTLDVLVDQVVSAAGAINAFRDNLDQLTPGEAIRRIEELRLNLRGLADGFDRLIRHQAQVQGLSREEVFRGMGNDAVDLEGALARLNARLGETQDHFADFEMTHLRTEADTTATSIDQLARDFVAAMNRLNDAAVVDIEVLGSDALDSLTTEVNGLITRMQPLVEEVYDLRQGGELSAAAMVELADAMDTLASRERDASLMLTDLARTAIPVIRRGMEGLAAQIRETAAAWERMEFTSPGDMETSVQAMGNVLGGFRTIVESLERDIERLTEVAGLSIGETSELFMAWRRLSTSLQPLAEHLDDVIRALSAFGRTADAAAVEVAGIAPAAVEAAEAVGRLDERMSRLTPGEFAAAWRVLSGIMESDVVPAVREVNNTFMGMQGRIVETANNINMMGRTLDGLSEDLHNVGRSAELEQPREALRLLDTAFRDVTDDVGELIDMFRRAENAVDLGEAVRQLIQVQDRLGDVEGRARLVADGFRQVADTEVTDPQTVALLHNASRAMGDMVTQAGVLRGAFTGTRQVIATALQPLLQPVAAQFGEQVGLLTQAATVLRREITRAGDSAGLLAAALDVETIGQAHDHVLGLSTAFQILEQALLDARNTGAITVEEFNRFDEIMGPLGNIIRSNSQAFRQMSDDAVEAVAALQRMGQRGQTTAAEFEGLRDALTALAFPEEVIAEAERLRLATAATGEAAETAGEQAETQGEQTVASARASMAALEELDNVLRGLRTDASRAYPSLRALVAIRGDEILSSFRQMGATLSDLGFALQDAERAGDFIPGWGEQLDRVRERFTMVGEVIETLQPGFAALRTSLERLGPGTRAFAEILRGLTGNELNALNASVSEVAQRMGESTEWIQAWQIAIDRAREEINSASRGLDTSVQTTRELADASDDVADSWTTTQRAGAAIERSSEITAEEVAGMRAEAAEAWQEFLRGRAEMARLGEEAGGVTGEMRESEDAAAALRAQMASTTPTAEELREELGDARVEVVGLSGEMEQTGESTQAAEGAATGLQAAIERTRASMAGAAGGGDDLRDSLAGAEDFAEETADEVREIDAAAAGAAGGGDDIGRGMRRAADGADDAGDNVRRMGNEMERTDRATERTGRGLLNLVRRFSGNIIPQLAAFFGIRELAQGINQAIDAAGNLEQSTALVTNVFGDLGDEAIEATTQVSQSLLLSDQAAQQAIGTFGNLLISLGYTEEAAFTLSDQILQLAADLASFGNVPIQDAITALRSGLIGEAEPLRRFGVALSEARVQALAVNQGLIAQGEELTDLQKVQLRAQIIMEDTALAQGDVARSSGQAVIEEARLAAEWENTQAVLGNQILPAYSELVTALREDVIPAIEEMGDSAAASFSSMVEGLADFAEELPDVLRETRQFFLKIPSFAGDATKGIQAASQAMSDLLQDLQEGATPAEAFAEGLEGIGDALLEAEEARWPGLDRGETTASSRVIEDMVDLIDNMGTTAGLTNDEMLVLVQQGLTRAEAELRTLDMSASGAEDRARALKAEIIALTVVYNDLLVTIGGGLPPEMIPLEEQLARQQQGVINFRQGIANELGREQGLFDRAGEEAGRRFQERLVASIGPLPGIAAPSVDFSDQLGAIDGFVRGIEEAAVAIPPAAETITSGFSRMGPAIDGTIDAFERGFTPIRATTAAILAESRRIAQELPETFGGAAEDIPEDIQTVIEAINLLEGLDTVVRDSVDGVQGAVDQLTSTMEGAAEDAPLSVEEFLDNMNASLDQAKGFSDSLNTLIDEGYTALAANLLAKGPAAANLALDFVKDLDAAEAGEAILDEAAKGYIDDGVIPGLEEALSGLEEDDPIYNMLLTMADNLESPELTFAITTAIDKMIQIARQRFQDGIEAIANERPTITPPPPLPTGGPGGTGTGGEGTGRPGANAPVSGTQVNVTINNPETRSVEEETGRLAQTVGGVVGLLN